MKKQLLALVSLVCLVISVKCEGACDGKDRWAIKTLQDAGAASITSTPQNVSIEDLIAVKQAYDETAPRHGVELQVYRVTGKIEGYKTEADGDLYIIIRDPKSGKTMVAEIPDPNCPNVATSPSVGKFRSAREQFGAFTTETKSALNPNLFKAKPGTYSITGVGFIDRNEGAEGQIGHADNRVEIHPVLSVERAP
jgi:hypothetical protein